MSPDLTSRLIDSFKPLLGDDFYFECDDGWYYLIHNMLTELSELNNSSIKVSQIKNKFGALRVYVDPLDNSNFDYFIDDEVYSIISKFENDSRHTCELCGLIGNIKNCNGWLRCTCDNH